MWIIGLFVLTARLVRAHLDFCTSWAKHNDFCGFKGVTYMSFLHCVINWEVFTLIFAVFFNHYLCKCNESRMLSVAVMEKVQCWDCKRSLNTSISLIFHNIVENIKIFCLYCVSDADDAKTHFLAHYQQFQLVCHHLHVVKVLLYVESVGVVTSGHVTKMAVKPFDLPCPKNPAICKLHGCIFYRTGVIADWSFTLRE